MSQEELQPRADDGPARRHIDRAMLRAGAQPQAPRRRRWSLRRRARWPELPDVTLPEVFLRLVTIERARADRSGRAFCVVALPLHPSR